MFIEASFFNIFSTALFILRLVWRDLTIIFLYVLESIGEKSQSAAQIRYS